MKQQTECDVIIVGGGPVGMGLAIDLGQRGVSVTAIERHTRPQRVPKGQNITQRSGEHFRAWGVSKAIRAAAPIPHSFGSAGVTAYGTLLSGYAYDWFRRAAVAPFYAAENERLPQYDTEAALRARAAGLASVDTFYGWLATGISQTASGVTVTLHDSATGQDQQINATFAVGCDGSASTMREAAGLAQDIDPHDRRMVLLVFDAPDLNRLLDRFPGKSYFNVLTPENRGYWQFLGRIDLEKRWFFHAPVPPGTTRDNFDFAGLVHRTIGAEFGIDFTHVGFWDLRTATARTYRAGRIFIAGDAAHSHPPYGGFGINTGFEDARNLGWKLHAALSGFAGPGLLDSYSAERRPVFADTAANFINRMIRDDRAFLAAFDPARDRAAFEAEWARRTAGGDVDVTGFEPHYEGSSIICGPPGGHSGARGRHRLAARAGHHLAPLALSSGDTVFDHASDGFTLLSLAAGGTARAFASAAATRAVPLSVIHDTAPCPARAYGASHILIRPDHFVAWAGDSASDPNGILSRAIGD